MVVKLITCRATLCGFILDHILEDRGIDQQFPYRMVNTITQFKHGCSSILCLRAFFYKFSPPSRALHILPFLLYNIDDGSGDSDVGM